MESKSVWADAIGYLYTVEGFADAADISADSVHEKCVSGSLLYIESSEGDILLPIAQLAQHGIVEGIESILASLPDDIIDPYMRSSWLNIPLEALDGISMWEELRANGYTEKAAKSIESFRRSLMQ